MMRKEGNYMPTVVLEVVTLVNIPDSTPHQEQPRGFHPQLGPLRAPYQQPTYVISTGPPPMQYRQPYAP